MLTLSQTDIARASDVQRMPATQTPEIFARLPSAGGRDDLYLKVDPRFDHSNEHNADAAEYLVVRAMSEVCATNSSVLYIMFVAKHPHTIAFPVVE